MDFCQEVALQYTNGKRGVKLTEIGVGDSAGPDSFDKQI